jgi:hypothetical protein
MGSTVRRATSLASIPTLPPGFGLMVGQPDDRDPPIFSGHPAVRYVTWFLAMIGTPAARRARHSYRARPLRRNVAARRCTLGELDELVVLQAQQVLLSTSADELAYRPAVIDRMLGGACGTDMTAIHTKGTERC